MNSLSIHKTKIHPNLLSTLQKVYLAKNKVVNKLEKKEQDLNSIFRQFNFYGSGQGGEVLKEMDSLFGFKQNDNIDSKLNQLLTTSLQDATYLASIEDLRNLKKEIESIVAVLKDKRGDFKETDLRITRGLKIDSKVQSFFDYYINGLSVFLGKVDETISVLEKNIPLNSTVQTDNEKFKKFVVENTSNDEKLLSELGNSFNCNFKWDSSRNRLEKITDLSPLKDTNSLCSELASLLFKFANDIRFLSSGPRSGFGEMTIPENEPGSSIMPGKVNPTQCESLTMVCCQVLGNTNAVLLACSSQLFEGNSFVPLVANNTIRSLVLLSDGLRSFRTKCLVGAEFIRNSLEEEVKNFKI